jgi:integrase
LKETEVRKITQNDCKGWARAYRKEISPTRYNNTVSVVRHVLNVAVEAGVVYSNAAAGVKRAAARSKEIVLPSAEQFNALIAEMRNGHSRESKNSADLAAGLAFTGCRISEAREIEWRDVDFDAGEVVVRITKNGEVRRVPLILDARALFQRMRSER